VCFLTARDAKNENADRSDNRNDNGEHEKDCETCSVCACVLECLSACETCYIHTECHYRVLVVESFSLFDEIHSVDGRDDCSNRAYYGHILPEARILARTRSPSPCCNECKEDCDYGEKENVKSAE